MPENREKALYEIAKTSFDPETVSIIGEQYFKEFTSTAEMVDLGLSIGVRRLIQLLSGVETDPKDIIAATKLLAILAGKDEIGVNEETVGRPTGTAGDNEILEAIKRSRKSTG